MPENSKRRNFGQIDSVILVFIDVGTVKNSKKKADRFK